MTDRQVYAAFLVVVVCIFAMLAWSLGAWERADARGDRAEADLQHLIRACDQRPDGSAVCGPRTFTPYPTTTAVPR